MVRTVKNHNNHHQEEEDEEDDEDYISRATYASSHKGGSGSDQKMDSYRSKHSETEQRRRSKINERFQILRDLIPENDQKKDRASFLLEVIQYIQFLQEKLQVYEGTYQGWTPERSNLMPWLQRGNCGTDKFADQPQPLQSGSIEEGHGATRAVSVDMPLHPNRFQAEPSNTPQGSFPNFDPLASHLRPQLMNAAPPSSEDTIYHCTSGELEEPSISDTYSKGLLNNLTLTLGSSGVDLSQASIAVQLDIRKGTSSYTASTSSGVKDHGILSLGNQATTHCGVRRGGGICNQAHKRPRTETNE
uniref:transcription factor BIM1-like isoform X2 n=1 Tax=Erigeron canadensis TaxID=72917 RepID=UPI001CB945FD|nr:transcription factor BIM1-like isoform X2 [Erigeron canadensis]